VRCKKSIKRMVFAVAFRTVFANICPNKRRARTAGYLLQVAGSILRAGQLATRVFE